MTRKTSTKKVTKESDYKKLYEDLANRKDDELKTLRSRLANILSDKECFFNKSNSLYTDCLTLLLQIELNMKEHNSLQLMIGVIIGSLTTLFTFFIFS